MVALCLAACGSTVQVNRSASRVSDQELGATDEFSADAPADSTSGSAASAVGGRSATPATRAAAGRSGLAATPAKGAPLMIGIGVDKNLDAFVAAFGASSSQPSEKDVAVAIVDDINANGGVAGHPLKAIYTEFDSTSNDWIAQDQASCAAFVEDNRVAAVVRTDDIFGPLDACLANAGVPLILYESYFRPTSWYNAAPGLRFVPDNPDPRRLYTKLVDRLVATKRWTPSTKIGLVRYDRGDQAEVEDKGIRPALAARGLKLTDSAAVHTPEGFQDLGQTSSQLATVIVSFRQQGIDNVVFAGGDLSYLFATAAQPQQYTPKYALTSFDFPNAMPPEQLHGAFGVGWEPTDDLSTALPVTPGVSRCQRATNKLNAQYDSAGVDRIYITCDQLYFLQAAYNAAGDVGPGALARGIRALRGSFAPAYTFAIDASAHPDGAAAVRDLFFNEACGCTAYGDTHPLP